MFDVKKIRELFPWFNYHREMVYFDNSATSLKPACVIDAYREYFCNFSTNPHNVSNEFTYNLKKKIELSRKKMAQFLNCNYDNLVFSASATESLNMFAFGLRKIVKKHDNVVIPEFEHSSNILPWYELSKITGASIRIVRQKKPVLSIQSLLNCIDKNTKVFSFSNCNNLLGFGCDAKKISSLIKKKYPQIIICLDATQYMQHHRLNLSLLSEIDFCAFSLHKLYGPTGVGVAYIGNNLLFALEPWKLGGGCYEFYSNNPSKMYKLLDNNARFEAGTPNVSGIFAVSNTIDFLQKLDWNEMLCHEMNLSKRLISNLKTIPNVTVVTKNPIAPIVSFFYKDIPSQDIADYLGRNNIIVRAGHSCAPLVCQSLGQPDGYVRISLGCYNTVNEVDFLIKKMRSFRKGDVVLNNE